MVGWNGPISLFPAHGRDPVPGPATHRGAGEAATSTHAMLSSPCLDQQMNDEEPGTGRPLEGKQPCLKRTYAIRFVVLSMGAEPDEPETGETARDRTEEQRALTCSKAMGVKGCSSRPTGWGQRSIDTQLAVTEGLPSTLSRLADVRQFSARRRDSAEESSAVWLRESPAGEAHGSCRDCATAASATLPVILQAKEAATRSANAPVDSSSLPATAGNGCSRMP